MVALPRVRTKLMFCVSAKTGQSIQLEEQSIQFSGISYTD